MKKETSDTDLTAIDDSNREYMVEWLSDRSAFHTWFSSLVIGSFVVINIFGEKPSFQTPSGVFLTVSVILFLFALLCNLVCVWSIPTWKYRVSTKQLSSNTVMKKELSITAWLGVIAFVCGLTLSVIGNSSL